MSHWAPEKPPSACDVNCLEQFLQSDQYRLEDERLIAHVDSCARCRDYLDSHAADPDLWRQASLLLQPGEFDRASSAIFSAASSPCSLSQVGDLPVTIQDVLDALAPTDDPQRLGRIGPYEVTGVVGVGGMGVVLKAIDPSLDRVVAVKVMAPRLANNATARRRFSREAKAAAAVLHPNVIPIHSVASDGPLPYLVMAFIRGGSLQRRLDKNGPLPLVEILRIGLQTAAGLKAAHEQGLVHRDIKPENILLEEGVERVTITDFGLARAVDDNTVTQSGAIAGTPMYMSPEQARGEQLDQRSDLFSLGSVLYALCTGRPPYRAESSYGVMRRIIDDFPTPIRELNPRTPEWFARIVERLMAKEQADRFQTAGEVSTLLAQCLAHVQDPQSSLLPDFVGLPHRSALYRRRLAVAGVVLLGIVVGLAATEATGVTRLAAVLARFEPGEKSPDASTAMREPGMATIARTTTEQTQWYSWPADAPPPAITPFDVPQAQLHQQRWADYLGVPVEYTNSIGMKFRLIPPGEFTMGSSIQEQQFVIRSANLRRLVEAEGPAHHVAITKPYYLSITEVTSDKFAEFVEATDYVTYSESSEVGGRVIAISGAKVISREFHWRNPSRVPQTPDCPVTQVSDHDVLAFCRWLNLQEGVQYELPTEAEWEFACRAGTQTPWFCGSTPLIMKDYAWTSLDYNGGEEMIFHPVGQKHPNAFGLFDMCGNVQEWCRDWFGNYPASSEIDPTGPKTPDEFSRRVIRGGALFDPYELRSAIRANGPAGYCENGVGIRLAIVGDLSLLSSARLPGEKTPNSPSSGPHLAPGESGQEPQGSGRLDTLPPADDKPAESSLSRDGSSDH